MGWIHGYAACDRGEPRAANPHTPLTPQWEDWKQGWLDRNRRFLRAAPYNERNPQP